MKRKHFIIALMAMLSCFAFTAKAQTSVRSLDALKAALASTTNILVDGEIVVDEAIAIPAGTTVGGDGTLLVRTMVYVVSTENPYPGVSYNKTATKNGSISGTVGCNVAYEISLDGGETWFDDTTNGKAQAVTVKEDGTKSVSASFQTAFASAKSGEIVHMLKDAHVQSTNSKKNNGPLRSYYGLILEGNGHTIYTDLESSGASNEYATIKFTSYLAGTGADVRPVLKNVTINSQNNSKADLDLVSGDVTFTVSLYNVNLLGKCQYAAFPITSKSAIINNSNVKLYDSTIPSWDAGSAKLIEFYSGEYSLSFNTKCKVYGGTFSNNPSSYLADCAQVKQENGKYVVSYKAAEVKVEVTPSDEFTSSATEEEKAVAKELAANTAVSNETLTLPVGVSNFTVQLTDIEATAEATTKVTFNVEPKNASGAKVSNPSDAITFRLPVPDAWSGKANVYHEGTLLGAYTIKEENGAKYVEVSSANFSEFAVEAIVPLFAGEGTEASPYIIDSADKLAALSNSVNGGEAYAGMYFKLTSDITLSGEWTAIGNGSRSSKSYTGNAFKGVFDGSNNTISGLTITSTTAADAAIGLFGVVDGGTVKNLNLTNVNINVSSSNLAGAAIGMMLNKATADNITVSGAIVGNDGVGGIVGRMIINGTIANCTNNASVTTSYGGIGGIVGKPYYDNASNTSDFATITNCVNNGTITAGSYAGGIAGLARANVTGCVNNGEIKGGTQTGGIIGELIAAGTVSGNENKGKVSGTSHVGGIIGDYTQTSAYSYYNVTIANNINRGEIAATGDRAAILGCNNVDGFTAMTATGNVSYYFVEGLVLFGNPEDMVIDATNKFVVPVAQVGTETFYTLAEAVAVAQAGDEIVIIANVELTETTEFPAGKTITLNLNNKKVSAADKNVVKNSGAALTIKNGTIERTGTVAGYAVNVVSGTLEVENVTINGGLFTSGSSLVATNTNINQPYSSRHAIYASNCAVTIKSGEYHNYNAGNATIFAYGSSVITIEDGTFSIDNGKQTLGWTSCLLDANAGGKYVINGGTFKGHFRVQANSAMEINGGTFENTNNEAYAIYGTAVVKGGTFTDAAAKNFAKNNIADDCTLGEEGKVVSVVAKIGEIKYETLDAAVAAAKVGDKITLLNDAELLFASNPMYNNIYASEIDLNGKTLTIKEGDLRFSNTTIKNGNIVVEPKTYNGTAIFLMYSKNLTLESVKVTATGVVSTYLFDLEGTSNLNLLNGSEILVDNSTVIDIDIICSNNGATENKVVIDNSKVTVNNIDGRVFFAGNYTVKDAEINLTGISKAGFRIKAGQKLAIEGTSKVTIEGELRDGGIHLTDLTATYTKAETATVNATLKEVTPAAVIGTQKFATLAAAITAATDGQTITLVSDVTEDLTIAKKITIDGAGKTYTGAMTLKADATFKNVNFDGKGYNGYAITTRGAQYLTIDGGSAKNYGYGFVQLASASVLTTVKNVTVSDMNYGVKVDYSNAVVLENVDITAGVAAVLNSNYGEKTITIKNSKLNKLGTWKRNETTKTNYVFEGANTVEQFITEDAIDNFKLAEASTLTAPEGKTVTTDVQYHKVIYADGKYALELCPAKIGEQGYATLQEAINAVQNGQEVVLLKDCAENVTLTEKVGLYYTINGDGKKLNGKITITPLSDENDNPRITIKGINFVNTADAAVDFISCAVTNHYPRLTVEGCTFTGNGNDTDVALRLKTAYGAVIKGCSGTGLHSFLQNTAGLNMTIENVKVTDSKSAFALGTVQGVTVKGCEAEVEGYGIRLDANTYNNNAVIENNTISAFIPVVVRKANTESNITVKGTNTFNASNTDGLWMAVGTSEYETNGELPTAATGKVKVVVNSDLPQSGLYGNHKEGSLSVAFAGETGYWGECGGNANYSFEFKFFNGETYMGSTSLNDKDNIIDGDVYVTWNMLLNAESNTDEYWTMAWTVAPTATMQPNRVEQWIDGVKVAECAIQHNGPDNLNEIKAIVTDAAGNIKAYQTSFKKALEAAQAGDAIELLADVNADAVILLGKSLTINGNGHKVTSSANRVFRVTTAAEVTLNNVNMVSTAFSSYTSDIRGISLDGGVQGVIELTLNNCSVDFDPQSGSDWAYAVNISGNASGYTLAINGGTYEGANVINIWGDNHVITIDGATLNNLYNAPQNGYYGQCVRFEGTGCSTTIKNSVFNGVHAVVVGEKTPAANTVAQENNTDNTKTYDVQVGTKYYYTLAEAFAAVEDNATIEVLRDIEETETAVNTKNVVLDLNGKTVTMVYNQKATKNHTMISNSGNLTIQSSVEGGKLSYTYAGENLGTTYSANTVTSNPGSVLTVKSGTIENLTFDSGIIAYAIDGLTNGGAGDVTVNIEGGVITSKRQALRIFANSTTNTGALNISGGDFTGRVIVQNASAKANKAALNITGGTFNANEYKTDVLYVGGSSSAEIEINATVSGGTFNGEITETNVAGFISGGTFANPVAAQYCAAGFMPNKNTDGTYGVVLAQDVVASIDGVTYVTLKAAVAAAKAGETITLLQDVKENVTISKHLTIDGASKTITGMITTDGKSLKVSIKNVNFNGNNKGIYYAVKADDDLNLVVENCSVDSYSYGFLYANKSNDKIVVKNVTVENCASYGAYLVSFNSATFENFTVRGAQYGVAVSNAGARKVSFKNVSFDVTGTPLYINETATGNVTFNFSGINDMGKAEYYTSQYVNVVAAAQVGTKVCGSLQDAVVAANDGETVKVLSDLNMTTANFVTQVDGYATLVNVAGKAVTIDLNGKTVTVNAAHADLNGKALGNMLMSVFHADPNGTLTLTDSSAEGTGTVELFANDAKVYGLIVSENAYDKSNPGKIIVNGGNYVADKLSDSMIFADINEVITVNGGNFHLGNVGTGANGKPWIFNASGNNQMHINVNGGTYNANVAKQYWTYEVNIGSGFTVRDNGDGTWSVVTGITLVDGKFTEYTNNETKEVEYISYTRNNIPTTWTSIYLPFEVPVSVLADQGFEVAYINGVRRDDKNDDGILDEFAMETIYIHGGDNCDGRNKTLKANYPYFIRTKGSTRKNLEITLEDWILYAAKDVTYDCTTMTEKYEITGNSSQMTIVNKYGISGGGWTYLNSAQTLKPFRFYMLITSRDNSEPVIITSPMRIVVRGHENEDGTTTIYDVVGTKQNSDVIYDIHGRRVLDPQKGNLYIINGKKVVY